MNDTLLTYEQWCARFKKNTPRDTLRKKAVSTVQQQKDTVKSA